jgi:hypothetical protein
MAKHEAYITNTFYSYMLESKRTERWKKIDGYDYYWVSNFGRIKSERVLKTTKRLKTQILCPIINEEGYMVVKLYNANDGAKVKMFYIHRLVFDTFHPRTEYKSLSFINKNCLDVRDVNIFPSDNSEIKKRWFKEVSSKIFRYESEYLTF